MKIRILPFLGLSLCTGLVAGCACADVALNQVIPPTQTLRVGESVTLQYETGGGCQSGNRTTDIDLHSAATVWHTSDTLVVAVDSISGRVTGRALGDAWVVSGGGSGSRIHVQ